MLRVLIGHVKLRDGAEEDISELLARLDIAMEGPLDEEPSSPAPAAPRVAPEAVLSLMLKSLLHLKRNLSPMWLRDA